MDSVVLERMERGVYMIVNEKFAKILMEQEGDAGIGTLVRVIGEALGQQIDAIEFPANWRRLLARKDCPAYMKDIQKYSVEVYYPKLPLPDEENWVTFNKREVING